MKHTALSDSHRVVAVRDALAAENSSQAAPRALVHALWTLDDHWPRDRTMCGEVESLDTVEVSKMRVVSCGACRAALKRERQRRSASELTEQRARPAGDYVETWNNRGYVDDEQLVGMLQRRAVKARDQGFEELAAELEVCAGRLAEHAQLPDDTSVTQRGNADLAVVNDTVKITQGDRVVFEAPVRKLRATHLPIQTLKRCAAGRDGECHHAQCPQLRDNEPAATGRHCPMDNRFDDQL